MGSLGQRFTCAAGEFGGSGYLAPLVDGEGGAERSDRFAGAVGGHALHENQGLRPAGHGLVGAGLGGEAVAEVGVGEGVDASVFRGVPPGQGVAVLLLRRPLLSVLGPPA